MNRGPYPYHSMRTRSKKEPFVDLPENVLEHVMSFCDVGTRLKMSETCPHLNRVLFSSPKLIDRVKLSIDFDLCSNDEMDLYLKAIQANHRKYQILELLSIYEPAKKEFSSLFTNCLEAMSATVKELVIEGIFKRHQISQLLKIFNNTEKLIINESFHVSEEESIGAFSKVPKLMPNLKELNLASYDLKQFLKLFEKVKTLTHLELRLNVWNQWNEETDTKETVEKFIEQQSGLKNLIVYGFTIRGSSLNKAEFLLESLIVSSLNLDFGAAEFFKRQTCLKTVKNSSSNLNSNPEAARAILTLPKLESLGIGYCVDGVLTNIVNRANNSSVLKLEYSGENSAVLEALISCFPNLREISCMMDNVALTDTPYEKLEFLKIHRPQSGYGCISFSYKLPLASDQQKFEEMLTKFLQKHDYIQTLEIGHIDWIGNDFKLSRNICHKIAELRRLDTLVLYNPMDIPDLITKLGNKRINVTIHTSAEGAATVAADGPHNQFVGPWLKIIVEA